MGGSSYFPTFSRAYSTVPHVLNRENFRKFRRKYWPHRTVIWVSLGLYLISNAVSARRSLDKLTEKHYQPYKESLVSALAEYYEHQRERAVGRDGTDGFDAEEAAIADEAQMYDENSRRVNWEILKFNVKGFLRPEGELKHYWQDFKDKTAQAVFVYIPPEARPARILSLLRTHKHRATQKNPASLGPQTMTGDLSY